MWHDLSFDLRSFDPESFGPSWGLTWEAAEELQASGGAAPAAIRPRRAQVFKPSVPVLLLPRGWRDNEAALLLAGVL